MTGERRNTVLLLTLVASLFLEYIAGSLYSWGNYSGAIKARLFGTNDTDAQEKLEVLGLGWNVGNYAPVSGFIFDLFGPPKYSSDRFVSLYSRVWHVVASRLREGLPVSPSPLHVLRLVWARIW